MQIVVVPAMHSVVCVKNNRFLECADKNIIRKNLNAIACENFQGLKFYLLLLQTTQNALAKCSSMTLNVWK